MASGYAGAEYRADIDGLRAVAVLSIVLAHLGIKEFHGGFVGVDIFFVISGFLITGILARSLKSGRYSIAEFYSRRVIRIFPALFVMLVTVTVLALIFLLPGELVRFAKSLAATSLFGSNMVFFSEAGYFDASSDIKPLLHTWSLGIEEQFYVLWPLILAAAAGARKSRLALIIASVALVSLLAAAFMVSHAVSAAFYLLPFRAWELAAGGLLVFVNRVHLRWLNELLAALGIGLIAVAIWRFTSATPFPGLAALFPVGGAVLIIFAGPQTLVSKVLALGPATWIGRLSYSLYLWHWPVIVFSKIGLLLPATPAVMAGQFAISLALAYASLRWVETPFRDARERWSTPRVLICALVMMAATVAVASVMILAKGFPQRFSPSEQALAAYTDTDFEARFQRGVCFAVDPGAEVDPACLASSGARPSVLLTGDSMAAHLWPGLSAYRGEYEVRQSTMVGCRPGVYPNPDTKCQRHSRELLTEWAPDHRPDVVVLAGRWQAYDMTTLEQTTRFLRDRNIAVVVVGPPPIYTMQLPRLLVKADQTNDPTLADRYLEPTSFDIDAQLRAIAEKNGARYVSLIDNLCQGRRCRTLAKPGAPMQFDYGHFTPEGSATVAGVIVPEIRQAMAAAGSR